MSSDVLGVAGTILEHMREANASGHGPWDYGPLVSCRHFLRSPYACLFLSFLPFVCKYFKDSVFFEDSTF
jgi:hypothetical protein